LRAAAALPGHFVEMALESTCRSALPSVIFCVFHDVSLAPGSVEPRGIPYGCSGFFPVGHSSFGFALTARYFSLLRQRKVPKRKAAPEACPLTRVPCASRRFGRSPNSQDLLRLTASKSSSAGRLARSQTGCDARLRLRVLRMLPLIPFRLRVARDARFGEERRESASADEGCGCLSLWVLSLGQARESTSPEGAKPGLECPMEIKSGNTPRRTPPCVPIPRYGTIPLIHTKHIYKEAA